MMRLPQFRYRAPQTLEEAAAWLAENPTATHLVAGGTDLLPNMKRRQQTPAPLIGPRALGELKRIDDRHGLTIGTGLTLAELVADRRIRDSYRGFWQAAAQGRHPPVAQRGHV